ncbi:hypothetical protein FA10DRAFT_302183 [Acaromyces ingoldii]|uniref:PXA domain-containing protein n=1 Tax=Acaromyces ingoldii TaxID=215250 RepID=A0A316YSL5_9BASI|nr:hypothetical protein FA10DRAFT_302183 [Acaromyces ingoldii]PWN91003.1 hypothetical protein FA10DRAFT_302183 [Acaromyces ingoldii]
MAEAEAGAAPGTGRKQPERPGAAKGRGGRSRPTELSGSPLVAIALAIGVLAVVVRSGWVNVVLVLFCSVLLLLNPWVRTFLELPQMPGVKLSADSRAKGAYSPFDPARFLNIVAPSPSPSSSPSPSTVDAADSSAERKESTSKPAKKPPLDRSESYAALRRMPAHLRRPLGDLEELVVRDFVCTWYEYHSFGDSCLPNEARYSIDHAMGSIYASMEHARTADVASELLLTATSVLLTTLRTRRLHPDAPPIFASDSARIAALREAIDRVFVRHMKASDGHCDMLRVLLREIISKQVWNALGGLGEPDFFNRKIVEWGQKKAEREAGFESPSAASASAAASAAASPVPPRHSYSSPVVPLAKDSADEKAATAGLLSPLESPTHTVPLSPTKRLASPASPSPGASAAAAGGGPARGASPFTSEPLTTQPRAMAMPKTMSIPSSSSSAAPSPALPPPPVPRRPTPLDRQENEAAPPALPQRNGMEHPSLASPRKPVPSPSKAEAEEQLAARDERRPSMAQEFASSPAMPMNVPPGAHQGMVLPESLRRSMASRDKDEEHDGLESEGYRLSGEESRRRDSQGWPPSSSSASSSARPSLDMQRRESQQSQPSSSSRPSLNMARLESPRNSMSSPSPSSSSFFASSSTTHKPPSRPPSAASGGIPPAPDLADVLSSGGAGAGNSANSGSGAGDGGGRSDSASMAALRDAFEAFLERGGATSRSLFFSPPSAATVAPGEGEALLKLHVGLATIAKLVPTSDAADGEIFRQDAESIVAKALRSLGMGADDGGTASRTVRDALVHAAQRLAVGAEQGGRVREVLRPVELTLWARLSGLYEHFWKETCTRAQHVPRTAPSPSAHAQQFNTQQRADAGLPLRYDARRANTLESAAAKAHGVSGSAPGSKTASPARTSLELPYEPRRKQAPPPLAAKAGHDGASLQRPGSTPPVRSSVGLGAASTSASASGTTSTDEKSSRPKSWLADVDEASRSSALMGPPPPPPPRAQKQNEAHTSSSSASRQDQPAASTSDGAAAAANAAKRPVPLRPDEVQAGTPLATDAIPASTGPLIEISVTDVSPNAERPNQPLDVRTLELMVAVEGLAGDGGGFVFMRQWSEFEALDRDLRTAQTGTSPTLPRARGKTSVEISLEVQRYLDELLSSPALVASKPVQHFVDKTRAGAPTGQRANALLNTLNLTGRHFERAGKSFASAVKLSSSSSSIPGGSNNNNNNEQNTAAPRAAKASADVPSTPPTNGSEAGAAFGGHYEGGARPTKAAAAAAAAASPPSSELSQAQLDNLLSSLFSIADEAFNLSGGWTLRRGMLRILEQIVRTQYWSSILGLFNGLAGALSSEKMGGWAQDVCNRFWPGGKWHLSDEGQALLAAQEREKQQQQQLPHPQSQAQSQAPPLPQPQQIRTDEDKRRTHAEAQRILLGYAPAQAGFILGPGGKQATERAMMLIHEEICSVQTSFDLALMLVLRLCDVVAR